MKLSYSFIFFVVLIYGTLCCFKVTADDGKANLDSDVTACMLQNLKAAGSLPDDFALNVNPTTCDQVKTLKTIYEDILWNIAHLMDMEMPDKKMCVTTEFETRERLLARYTAIPAIRMADFLTEDEKQTHLTTIRNEFKQELKDVATKCGAEEDKFVSYFDRHFDDNAKI